MNSEVEEDKIEDAIRRLARKSMLVSIEGRLFNYRGPGWYCVAKGNLVYWAKPSDEERGSLEYIDLEGDEHGPTHEVDIPTNSWVSLSFAAGFLTGFLISIFIFMIIIIELTKP